MTEVNKFLYTMDVNDLSHSLIKAQAGLGAAYADILEAIADEAK